MHEMALAESVLQIVQQAARGQDCIKATLIRLDIGALSHVEPDALRFCFEAVVKGTVAEGAALEITRAPGCAWCHDCAGQVPLAALGTPCPECGGYRLEVTGGTDMRVRDMEVE